MTLDTRPAYCRDRLRDEGKSYPRSGCQACVEGGLRGCPHDHRHETPPPLRAVRTASMWVNFYAKGNASIHFTRETADEMAFDLPANPRIACIEVSAEVGQGLE